jgi:hypothetical protein
LSALGGKHILATRVWVGVLAKQRFTVKVTEMDEARPVSL